MERPYILVNVLIVYYILYVNINFDPQKKFKVNVFSMVDLSKIKEDEMRRRRRRRRRR